jgi:hypothetical protein
MLENRRCYEADDVAAIERETHPRLEIVVPAKTSDGIV